MTNDNTGLQQELVNVVVVNEIVPIEVVAVDEGYTDY